MNSYTIDQQQVYDDTEAPPIKYSAEGKITKEYTKYQFVMNYSNREVNNPEPDYRTGFQEDYLKTNPQ